jgi:hypothetical protein
MNKPKLFINRIPIATMWGTHPVGSFFQKVPYDYVESFNFTPKLKGGTPPPEHYFMPINELLANATEHAVELRAITMEEVYFESCQSNCEQCAIRFKCYTTVPKKFLDKGDGF